MYSSLSMLWKTYNDGKLSVQNHDLNAPLRHIGVNCSSARTEVVTEDPLLQLDNTLWGSEPVCRIDMHSDTAIEEHHHFKVFCYIILVYHGCHFEFVGNFLSRMRFHIKSYVVVFNTLCVKYQFLRKGIWFLDLRRDLLYFNTGGGGGGVAIIAAICAFHKKFGGN